LKHYENEILKLKDAVTKATEVKNDVLNKLKQEKETGKKENLKQLEYEAILTKEKQKIESFIGVGNTRYFRQRRVNFKNLK